MGKTLPRAADAFGVREKLASYSLDPRHAVGGPKARGFERILGITVETIEYLVEEILAGILDAPVCAARSNPPFGINCAVELPIAGIGLHSQRTAIVRTIWELAEADAAPRLVSAYIKA